MEANGETDIFLILFFARHMRQPVLITLLRMGIFGIMMRET